MLILSRRESECIHLGDDIVLTIVRVSGEKVRIGVDAPAHVKILRNELDLGQSKEEKLTVGETAEASCPSKVESQSDSPVTPESIPLPSSAPTKIRKVPIQIKRSA